MEMMMKKLMRKVPVLEKEVIFDSNVAHEMVRLRGGMKEEYLQVPYLAGVTRYFEKEESIINKRIILVSDNVIHAMKVALCMMHYWKIGDDHTEKLFLVDFSQEIKTEESIANPWICFAEWNGSKSVFYYEIDSGKGMRHKQNLINASKNAVEFIYVTRDEVHRPWVMELMKERESNVVHIPEVEDDYDEKVLSELLEGERYQFAKEVQSKAWIRQIKKKCGLSFAEEDMAWALDMAIGKKFLQKDNYELTYQDFSIEESSLDDPLTLMNRMVGLHTMKKVALEYAALCKEKARNSKLKELSKHMVFAGNPGTGKTMCASYMASIAETYGEASGTYLVVTRKDIIGKYVGHTAPMVEQLFKRARNGVMFVDEAGFFLRDSGNGFTQEAVKEFVRFMELYQDVMVIFALYPGEVEEFMELDAGLSSRISRVVEFENYTEEELMLIMESMCNDRGYQLEEDAKSVARSYLSLLCDEKKERFGNAREARKLVESAIVSKSIRCFEQTSESENFLNKEDLEESCCRLKASMETGEKKRTVGFRV